MMTSFSIPDMHCSGCARGVEAALKQVPGVEALRFDLEGRIVEVVGTAPAAILAAAIRQAGFNPIEKAG